MDQQQMQLCMQQHHNNTAQHAFECFNMVVNNVHLTANKQPVINDPTTVIKIILY